MTAEDDEFARQVQAMIGHSPKGEPEPAPTPGVTPYPKPGTWRIRESTSPRSRPRPTSSPRCSARNKRTSTCSASSTRRTTQSDRPTCLCALRCPDHRELLP